MTNEEIFHQFTLPFGGRLDRRIPAGRPAESLYIEVERFAVGLIADARNHVDRLPEIHFDYVHNGKINAYAFKSDGRYFIGVTTGALYMLQLVFGRMLSDAGLFPNIGDPDNESHDFPPLRSYVPDAQRMWEVGIRPKRPTTAPRRAYEVCLFHAAVFFLLGHEIAHITRGHVDYLASNSGTSLISEIEFNREDEEANIERQAIETDADRRSIWSCVASIELTLATPNLANAPWLPSRRLGLTDLIFDWAFAINSLFRLFGDKRFNPGDLETEVYPPHPLRRVIATNIAYTGLVFREPGRKGIVLPVLRDAMVYTDLAFARILGEEVRADGLDVAWSPLGKEHHERLLNESLRTLNDRLAPFAFEPDVVQLSDEQPRIPGTAAPPG